MGRSTFRPTLAMTWPLAAGHGGERDEPRVIRPMANDTRHWPAGYLFSSGLDLARFAIAFLNEGRLEGKTVILPAVLARMATPRAHFPRTFDGEAYGYGLFIDDSRGVRVVGHGGQMPGFSAEWRLVPKHRLAVIVLANREGLMFRRTLAKALEMLGVPPAPALAPVAAVPMSAEEMGRYAGAYEGRWPLELLVKDGGLFLKWGGGERPVTKVGDGRFQVPRPPGEPVEFRLVTDGEGRPLYIQMFLWAFKRVGSP
jgi:CubicO group peptidase (beta-lactamase class C family)